MKSSSLAATGGTKWAEDSQKLHPQGIVKTWPVWQLPKKASSVGTVFIFPDYEFTVGVKPYPWGICQNQLVAF